MAYLNFDLLVERYEGAYRIRLLDSPAGQATEPLGSRLDDLNLEEFLQRVGRPFRASLRQHRRTPHLEAEVRNAVLAFGTQLFGAIFPGQIDTALRRSLDEAERQDTGLRIRLRLAEVPELAELPWEYVYDPVYREFVTVSTATPLVRYLELPRGAEPVAVVPPLRILVVIASPLDRARLDVEGEWEMFKTALAALEREKRIAIERLEEATLPALQRWLRQGEYHILHYIGHGDFEPQIQEGVLFLEDEDQLGVGVGAEEWSTLLRDERRTLRLVVLNACKGARSSLSDPFAGVAQGLVQKGIPAVIAMQFAISDVAAGMFSREFYRSLADGFSIDAALAEARKAIYLRGNKLEWGIPALFMRSPDGKIFRLAEQGEGDGPQGGSPAPNGKGITDKGGVSIQIGSVSDSEVRISEIAGGDIIKDSS